jgi:endonuclease/exonuclease/phosphatase (EEP) superfamily protein YafD
VTIFSADENPEFGQSLVGVGRSNQQRIPGLLRGLAGSPGLWQAPAMGNLWREKIRAGRTRRRGGRPVVWLSILGGAVSVLGFAGGLWWVFDLCTHFQAQYLVFQGLCLLALLAFRRFRWALVAALFLCVPAWRLAPYYRKPAAETPLRQHLKVLSFNVLSKNTRYADTLRWVQQTDPDIAFFPEVTPVWLRGLEPLKTRMPYSIAQKRVDNFGCAVFSKYPIVEKSLVPSEFLEVAMMQVTLEIDGRRVFFVGLHPLPPMSPASARDRNAILTQLARQVHDEPLPVIVAGDFNATPWSHGMKPLFDVGLRDTMLGRGFSATWRREIPIFALPIDHILIGGQIRVAERWTGPDLGSDHRPVVAELRW